MTTTAVWRTVTGTTTTIETTTWVFVYPGTIYPDNNKDVRIVWRDVTPYKRALKISTRFILSFPLLAREANTSRKKSGWYAPKVEGRFSFFIKQNERPFLHDHQHPQDEVSYPEHPSSDEIRKISSDE